MLVVPFLERLCAAGVSEVLGEPTTIALRAAKDPAHGDFQINEIMALAKKRGKSPRSLAEPVAERLRREAVFADAQVAGPGFINLRLHHDFIARAVVDAVADAKRAGVPQVPQAMRIVVDFSSPNIAKQMHVGHLRSTIIGDSLCRMLRFVGHDVLGDNHIGDWGTQFGLLIVGMRAFGDEAALQKEPIEELERVYKLASAKAKEDETFASEARAELAKLQQGDADNRALWTRFVDATRQSVDVIYDRLGVKFDLWLGESAYQDQLKDVVDLLLEKDIARVDQGAVCVFFDENTELGKNKTPFIIQKQDGAFLYSTTDIATVLYRRDTLHADASVYVVDQRQAQHFKQLFFVMQKLGVTMELTHVGFGTVLGRDGTPLKTRDGSVIKLADLLNEAEQRAAAHMREESPHLNEQDIAALSPVVGIGAVKYADLCQNRLSDYRFDWEKLISFKGNAGPYLQYAHARVAAIFRKAEIEPGSLQLSSITLTEDAELTLAKSLMRFADVVHEAARNFQPHLVCDHLYAIARQFSAFYEACPVLKAADNARQSRLALCALTARQLRIGLDLLGIAAPDRM